MREDRRSLVFNARPARPGIEASATVEASCKEWRHEMPRVRLNGKLYLARSTTSRALSAGVTHSVGIVPLPRCERGQREAAERLFRRNRLRLRHRRPIGADFGVPRTRKTTAADLVTREDVVVGRPFGARHLVKDLDAVAVRIARIDAERDAVIRNVLDRPALRLDAVVEALEIVERLEPPSHVVEPDLALLLQRRIIAQLHQRDLVRLVGVGRHEGSPARAVLIGVQPEQILVPLLRPLGVADINVDVLQIHRSLAHRALALLPVPSVVTLAKAGVQGWRRYSAAPDSRFRGNDELDHVTTPQGLGQSSPGNIRPLAAPRSSGRSRPAIPP